MTLHAFSVELHVHWKASIRKKHIRITGSLRIRMRNWILCRENLVFLLSCHRPYTFLRISLSLPIDFIRSHSGLKSFHVIFFMCNKTFHDRFKFQNHALNQEKMPGQRVMPLEFAILKAPTRLCSTSNANSFLSVVSCFGHFVWIHISVKMHYMRRFSTLFDHFYYKIWISLTLLLPTACTISTTCLYRFKVRKTRIWSALCTWYVMHKRLCSWETNVIFRNFQFGFSHKKKNLWCI